MKRGWSLSFLVGTISNVLVMEIGWTDVGVYLNTSLTYIPFFSVKFFNQPIYTDYANYAYFDKRSHLNLVL